MCPNFWLVLYTDLLKVAKGNLYYAWTYLSFSSFRTQCVAWSMKHSKTRQVLLLKAGGWKKSFVVGCFRGQGTAPYSAVCAMRRRTQRQIWAHLCLGNGEMEIWHCYRSGVKQKFSRSSRPFVPHLSRLCAPPHILRNAPHFENSGARTSRVATYEVLPGIRSLDVSRILSKNRVYTRLSKQACIAEFINSD